MDVRMDAERNLPDGITKEDIRNLLVLRAGNILDFRRLDAMASYLFCGVERANEIQIYSTKDLKIMADMLGCKIKNNKRKCDIYPFEWYFMTELFGEQWTVFALSEVAYEN